MDSFCVRAFAEALEVVPYTLAENAGLNPIQIVTELRKLHAAGDKYAGINVKKVRVVEGWAGGQHPCKVARRRLTRPPPQPAPHRAPSPTCWRRTWCSRCW